MECSEKRFALLGDYRFLQRMLLFFMTCAENQITGKIGLIFQGGLIILGENNVFLRLLFQQKERETFRVLRL